MDYGEFIKRKSQLGGDFGFAPLWMPETAFDFQKHLIEWATKKGRCEVIADCGLGKTLIQQTWAEVVRVNGNTVRIGIEAPEELRVIRGELKDLPREGNRNVA